MIAKCRVAFIVSWSSVWSHKQGSRAASFCDEESVRFGLNLIINKVNDHARKTSGDK